MKVFLSQSFATDDRDLVRCLERLLSSHDVLVVRGRRLAGNQLTTEIKKLIDGADALVAFMTRRDRIGEQGRDLWRSSRWIDYEYTHARDQGKQAIALVENGVEDGGPYEGYERIHFERTDMLEAFLALSETLRIWKESIGIPGSSRSGPTISAGISASTPTSSAGTASSPGRASGGRGSRRSRSCSRAGRFSTSMASRATTLSSRSRFSSRRVPAGGRQRPPSSLASR